MTPSPERIAELRALAEKRAETHPEPYEKGTGYACDIIWCNEKRGAVATGCLSTEFEWHLTFTPTTILSLLSALDARTKALEATAADLRTLKVNFIDDERANNNTRFKGSHQAVTRWLDRIDAALAGQEERA